MFVKELSGHSGCKLCLYKKDNGFFVRKSATNPSYSARLKRQCAKQIVFSSPTILTPKVLARGNVEGKFYFDMDFVQGKTLAESVASTSIHDIEAFMKILFDTMVGSKGAHPAEVNLLFKNKIEQLQEATIGYPQASPPLQVLSNFDWQHVIQSPCHGDLTLENILITQDKSLFVIDLLDSFCDSWMIDIAKLLQDLALGWSFRNQQHDTTRDFRLLVAKEALLGEIQKMDHYPSVLATIYHLLLMTVLRIYPYAKDEPTIHFLDVAVQKVMYILNTDVKRQAT